MHPKFKEVHRALALEARERAGGELLGSSLEMQRLRQEIGVVAPSDLTVLIQGETGTGKELVARTVHLESERANSPLIHVNCAALPEGLAESELFGHVKGAFTGANSNRKGKFELANKGTLFLDEIGELPLLLQAKILRALQFGEVQRVGADTLVQVDVRVIAATNRDLAEEVEKGDFREDLFHRLSVYPIDVPPLRDRGDDILELAEGLLTRAQKKLRTPPLILTQMARMCLIEHRWPGNIRELDHVLMRAALRAKQSSGTAPKVEITPMDLDLCSHCFKAKLGTGLTEPQRNVVKLLADTESHPTKTPEATQRPAETPAEAEAPDVAAPIVLTKDHASLSAKPDPPEPAPHHDLDTNFDQRAFFSLADNLPDAIVELQVRAIELAVNECDGNWAAAARMLGMDRSNLHRLAKRLGMK